MAWEYLRLEIKKELGCEFNLLKTKNVSLSNRGYDRQEEFTFVETVERSRETAWMNMLCCCYCWPAIVAAVDSQSAIESIDSTYCKTAPKKYDVMTCDQFPNSDRTTQHKANNKINP